MGAELENILLISGLSVLSTVWEILQLKIKVFSNLESVGTYNIKVVLSKMKIWKSINSRLPYSRMCNWHDQFISQSYYLSATTNLNAFFFCPLPIFSLKCHIKCPRTHIWKIYSKVWKSKNRNEDTREKAADRRRIEQLEFIGAAGIIVIQKRNNSW